MFFIMFNLLNMPRSIVCDGKQKSRNSSSYYASKVMFNKCNWCTTDRILFAKVLSSILWCINFIWYCTNNVKGSITLSILQFRKFIPFNFVYVQDYETISSLEHLLHLLFMLHSPDEDNFTITQRPASATAIGTCHLFIKHL